MNILLTGVNGFLGKSIAQEISKENEVFGLSRTTGEYKISLEYQIPDFDQDFDLVIHAAGKAHSVPKTQSERKQFYDVNVMGTENLLKGLEKSGLPKQFVFISSVSVYGQEFGKDINEEHQLEANEPYGLSKIEAELLITKWCIQNNVICTILRLPLLVGNNAPGNLGAMIKAIEKGYYFNIDEGKARKSMVLAKDVAEFIPKLASIGGIYNLTDGVHPNFKELSIAIAKQKKKKMPLNLPLFIAHIIGFAGNLLGDKAPINSSKIKKITSDLTFDDTKAREVAGWKAQEVLEFFKNEKI
ncbi:NAD-dependent epimerase/dehydratase family protein [Flavobacterium gilvum]|uniref:UDP-galactose-4-epimerase n=1 Tax=Flavobacterium gilvum TaxID=1492737 RepID=A0AAC9I279_9FLAO|nr:NAD-dependent epimerase/dehydratase family protein [Flavobacterium gilvum]AOW08145.1 UDP-galactose-4-epimerase [Flavobacterium gilvum]KFC59362.1 UDP-galactose 4-epimerase [Flavobacterium gilvum]